MRKINIYIFLGFLIFVAACTKDHKLASPESVLENYVKIAINAKTGADRKSLFYYLTGEALKRLKDMSDEDFFETLVRPKYKFVHFSTRHFQEQKGNTGSLVYELVYESSPTDKIPVQITVRKVAYFTRVNEKEWKISNTKNIKSFIAIEKGMQIQYP